MNRNIIEVKNITKIINGKKILDNISFNISKNSIVGLIGPNGAGKSTLLKIMTGLYTIDKGDVLYYGKSLKNDYEDAIRNVGSIIETPDMYNNLSGYDNLEIFKVMFKGVEEETIKSIVNIVNLEKSIGKKFKNYSLGMKERLGIAASLLGSPKILILDEPTNGLDPIGIKNMRSILKNLENTTVVISSHMLSEIENICDEVIFLNDGKIIERKNLSDFKCKSNIEFKVDDKEKAKMLIKEFNEEDGLIISANEEKISDINKKLVLNNIKVYRICEKNSNLESDFFNKLRISNDKSN